MDRPGQVRARRGTLSRLPALVILVGTLAVTAVGLLARAGGEAYPTLGHGPAVLTAALLAVLLARTPRSTGRTLALGAVVPLVVAGTLGPALTLHAAALDTYGATGEATRALVAGIVRDPYVVAVLAPATVVGAAVAAARTAAPTTPPRTSRSTRAVWLTIAACAGAVLALGALLTLLPDGDAVLSTTLSDVHLTRLDLQPWVLVLAVVAVVSRAARHGVGTGWIVALLAATAFHVGSPTRGMAHVDAPVGTLLELCGVVGHSTFWGWDGAAILAGLVTVAAGIAMMVAARLDRAPEPLAAAAV